MSEATTSGIYLVLNIYCSNHPVAKTQKFKIIKSATWKSNMLGISVATSRWLIFCPSSFRNPHGELVFTKPSSKQGLIFQGWPWPPFWVIKRSCIEFPGEIFVFFHFNLRWAVAPNRSLLRTSLERMLRLEIGRPPLLNREILCWPAITRYGFFKPRPKMRSNQTEVIENGNGNCTDLKMCFLLKMVIF